MPDSIKKSSSFTYSIEKTDGKSARTYVFIHDIGFDKRLWFPIMTDIGSGVRAVAYDLDGFGANATNALPSHTMEHHVDNLFTVLSKAKVKSPVLIGVRFGGHIALQALRRDSDRFDGAMIGGVLPYAPMYSEYSALSDIIATVPKKGSSYYADRLIADLNIDHDNSSQLHYQISASNERNIAATLTASLTRPSALNALLDFSHPICLLAGQNQDERIQKECLNISFNQPNMAIVRIPESTTLYNLENPHAFRNAVVRFIKLFEQE